MSEASEIDDGYDFICSWNMKKTKFKKGDSMRCHWRSSTLTFHRSNRKLFLRNRADGYVCRSLFLPNSQGGNSALVLFITTAFSAVLNCKFRIKDSGSTSEIYFL